MHYKPSDKTVEAARELLAIDSVSDEQGSPGDNNRKKSNARDALVDAIARDFCRTWNEAIRDRVRSRKSVSEPDSLGVCTTCGGQGVILVGDAHMSHEAPCPMCKKPPRTGYRPPRDDQSKPGELVEVTMEATKMWYSEEGRGPWNDLIEEAVSADIRANVARATEELSKKYEALAIDHDILLFDVEKAKSQAETDKATIAELRARIDELKESWHGLNDANNEKAVELAEMREKLKRQTAAREGWEADAGHIAKERDAARAELAQVGPHITALAETICNLGRPALAGETMLVSAARMLREMRARLDEFEEASAEAQGIDEENHHLKLRVRELEDKHGRDVVEYEHMMASIAKSTPP